MTPEQQANERRRNTEYRRRYPDRVRARARAYHRAHPEKRSTHSAKRRCAKHGLTVAQFGVMLGKQEGLCAICTKPLIGTRQTHIDHDHQMGKVRALLCHQCNKGLGNFRENPALLLVASAYLAFHKAVA